MLITIAVAAVVLALPLLFLTGSTPTCSTCGRPLDRNRPCFDCTPWDGGTE